METLGTVVTIGFVLGLVIIVLGLDFIVETIAWVQERWENRK